MKDGLPQMLLRRKIMNKKIKDIPELQKICTPLEANPEVVDKINELGSSPQHSSEEVATAFKKIYERLKNYGE